jgi:hypothetical protein
MDIPPMTPRRLYEAWVEEQIEDYKSILGREELLSLADSAVDLLFASPDGQYPPTEILLCDAVDQLLAQRLNLPSYRQWLRMHRTGAAGLPLDDTPGTTAICG